MSEDTADFEPIERTKMRNGKNFMQGVKNASIASANENYRRSFYDQRNRPKPSLPKLSFLKGE